MGGKGSGRRRRCPKCEGLMVRLARGSASLYWCQECGHEESANPRRREWGLGRDRRVSFRVTEETYSRIAADAEREGVTVSEYARRKVTGGRS